MTPEPPLWPLYAAGVIAVVLIGFVSGTREPEAPAASPVATASADEAVPRYAELSARRRGVNAGRFADGVPGGLPVGTGTRAEAVDTRAARRAYDGAPPTIPHAIDQRGLPTCLTCHRKGAVIGGKVARVMSHPEHASCVQCHVVDRNPRTLELTAPPANDFVGLASAGAGTRAWPGAPPVMPHGAWMRETCIACHGPAGHPGLRTSHPERQSCRQCHAPEARSR